MVIVMLDWYITCCHGECYVRLLYHMLSWLLLCYIVIITVVMTIVMLHRYITCSHGDCYVGSLYYLLAW